VRIRIILREPLFLVTGLPAVPAAATIGVGVLVLSVSPSEMVENPRLQASHRAA